MRCSALFVQPALRAKHAVHFEVDSQQQLSQDLLCLAPLASWSQLMWQQASRKECSHQAATLFESSPKSENIQQSQLFPLLAPSIAQCVSRIW